MSFLHAIIEADQWMFEVINSGMSNPLFDALLPWCRERWFWAPLYLFIGAFSLINFGRRGWLVIVGLTLAVGLSDLTSSRLIKKNVQRIRPCNDVEMADHIRLRVPCGGGYSFTSSHASNHFAAAVLLIGLFGVAGKWQQKALLSWAALIAFSQVYVGVHYPMDVLLGATLGCFIGWLMLQVWRRFLPLPGAFNRHYP